jgi:CHAT domain-containing protein
MRALSVAEKISGAESLDAAIALSNLGVVFSRQGDAARAIFYMTRGNEVSEHNLALVLTTGSENQKRLYLETLAGEADAIVWLHVRGAPKNADAARMALTAVLQRKGRALDAMSDEIAALRRAAPQDRALLERLGDARSELSALQLSEANSTAKQARIKELETEIERLEAEISRRSAEFRAQTQSVTLEAVKQAIPDDAALVEIFSYRIFDSTARGGERLGAPQYVAYVLDRNTRAPRWVELGDAATIDAMIAKLRAALADPNRADARELARAVDERVMRPVRNLLGARRHIFLSPDGALNLIPFGALVDENGKYLIENYSITYLTSGRDLLRLQIHGASPQAPVILANPKFDLSGARKQTQTNSEANSANRRSSDFVVTQYPTLPGTAIEARSLACLMPDSQMLVDSQATEAR